MLVNIEKDRGQDPEVFDILGVRTVENIKMFGIWRFFEPVISSIIFND